MTGEIAAGGVYIPALLVLAAVALVLTGVLTRLLAAFSVYRFLAYRPLVDITLFVFLLGMLVFVSEGLEPMAR